MPASPPARNSLIKLTGKIGNYKRTRGESNFMLTEADRAGMGVVAIAAGLAGLSGQAISTASNAADTSESAHFIECTIDGTPVAGWVWRSPFKEGDEVEAAAYWDGKDFLLQGVRRLSDGMTALYPHCSRGRKAHNKNALKWWAMVSVVLFGFYCLIPGSVYIEKPPNAEEFVNTMLKVFGGGALFFTGFFGLMIYSMSRKWLPMVYAAESVFRTLGWTNPEDIDLVKLSKQFKRGGEGVEYGIMYFRYLPKV